MNAMGHGSYIQGSWYVPPILGWHGMAADASLTIPLGLGVRYVTPELCLENQYLPLDENGDPITEDIPMPTMEQSEYRHQMDARCYKLPQLVTEDGETFELN